MLTSCLNILIIVINKSAKSGIGEELFYLLIGLMFKLYTLLGIVYALLIQLILGLYKYVVLVDIPYRYKRIKIL